MTVVLTSAERPDLPDRPELENVWPEYNRHGETTNRFWDRLYSELPEFQFVLYDPESDRALAEGHTIPCRWDGTPEGLPRGIDGLLEGAFALRAAGGRPDTLSALAIEIAPGARGAGLSATMIAAMARIARDHDLGGLIAPLRPTWKERYPLTPIERYAAWTREDGLPFDPWIRTHVRLGAEILRPEPESLRIAGTVAEWESWIDLPLPESGEYVFPHGLAPLRVDREADLGLYYEPNVWVGHSVASSE
jgi:GNAT superfamily N-acetyltransferase